MTTTVFNIVPAYTTEEPTMSHAFPNALPTTDMTTTSQTSTTDVPTTSMTTTSQTFTTTVPTTAMTTTSQSLTTDVPTTTSQDSPAIKTITTPLTTMLLTSTYPLKTTPSALITILTAPMTAVNYNTNIPTTLPTPTTTTNTEANIYSFTSVTDKQLTNNAVYFNYSADSSEYNNQYATTVKTFSISTMFSKKLSNVTVKTDNILINSGEETVNSLSTEIADTFTANKKTQSVSNFTEIITNNVFDVIVDVQFTIAGTYNNVAKLTAPYVNENSENITRISDSVVTDSATKDKTLSYHSFSESSKNDNRFADIATNETPLKYNISTITPSNNDIRAAMTDDLDNQTVKLGNAQYTVVLPFNNQYHNSVTSDQLLADATKSVDISPAHGTQATDMPPADSKISCSVFILNNCLINKSDLLLQCFYSYHIGSTSYMYITTVYSHTFAV